MMHVVPSRKSHRAIFAVCLFAVSLSAMLFAQDETKRGRKYTPPPPTSKITVTVIKATSGKPVENAAVIFHPMKNGKDEGNLELKTNEEGKAAIDVVPIGDTMTLQIIASGFQTFGEDYKITTDTKEIVVRLKRPQGQYSIYDHAANSGNSSSSNTQSSGAQSNSQKSNDTQPKQ